MHCGQMSDEGNTARGPRARLAFAASTAATVLSVLVLGVAGVARADAIGAGSSTAAATGPTTPTRVTARLYTSGVFHVKGMPITIPGRPVQLTGVVRPYVSGQVVKVRALLDGRLFRTDSFALKPSKRAVYGWFSARILAPGPGRVSVQVIHVSTSAMVAFESVQAFTTLNDAVSPGSTGRFVELIQQRLAALHLYVPQTGVYDDGTELAVDAYHRLLGWGTSPDLDLKTVMALLGGQGAFRVRFPAQGRHAEGNLRDQLLALIDGTQVVAIYPISSGKPSTPTILGEFHVYRKTPGYLPDGMYYSSFFSGGYAIHGYDPAPDYPASHGCMRLPISDAVSAFDWLQVGESVDVYGTPNGSV